MNCPLCNTTLEVTGEYQSTNLVNNNITLTRKYNCPNPDCNVVPNTIELNLESKPTIEEKRKYCNRCRDNFYNDKKNNPSGQCWSLETSNIVIRKFVPVDQRPPYDNISIETTLDCHRRDRHVAIDPTKA